MELPIHKGQQLKSWCTEGERRENSPDLFHNKEAIWLYAELFLGHHDGSCHGLWWFVVIHVMLCAGFCHGSWWFMSWFVVICGDSCHGKLVVICSDLWWFMSPFVVVYVMVCGSSVENSLRYWPKHAVLVETWGCYPSFQSSRKVNPTSWRFHANPSRIHWDIDRNMQF